VKPWKLQKFAGDVVYDLRSRGLLPVAVLLLVGMVAVPLFLVRGGSESGSTASGALAQAVELAPENQAAVVAYEAGVRDYKERLGEDSPSDPFSQQFTTPEATATALEQSGVETGATSLSGGGGGSAVVDEGDSGSVDSGSGSSGNGGSGSGGSGSGGSGNGGGGSAKVKAHHFLETDVQIGVVGEQTVRRNRVQPFQYLPGEQAPVLAFMGYAQKGSKAVFLVSQDVSALEGEGSCFPSPESCQLLKLKEGQSETLTYGEGPEAVAYKARVARIELRSRASRLAPDASSGLSFKK